MAQQTDADDRTDNRPTDGPTHQVDKIQAGENVRLSVELPAHGDEYHHDAPSVSDYLFVAVDTVERFDAGDIKEMTVRHRERGRLRVRWNGDVLEPETERKLARHRGDVLRLNAGTEAM